MSTTRPDEAGGAAGPEEPAVDPYVQLQRTDEFQDLRRRFRSFVFPMTAFFLLWYFAYVLAAVFAPGFMSVRIWGVINVGLVFGLLQFVTTFAITFIYARWANREFDPRAEALGARMEQLGGAGR
ncbi:DUF485 domain-containing protein [Ornithinimicrobium humiphilum]|uniref:Uncharacterized membrane protein (DUF485 family) n=1 Tax=Ornithinimicrobium humiphilum TaxID=125288 RepID=A0A543K6Q2_9MICO|nr:DUF485 domain-containing protein [Ornithinimicrobium humiphilum]TQM90763.1 uncharacterized membrane protein (DUF485 family) [Ornithinimicrobium humiphilum]